MTKGIQPGEKDPRIVYRDIIDLPHHTSSKHPAMSLLDRAAQFAPFAALTGYEDMIEEEARLTEKRIELGEEGQERLNAQLAEIAAALEKGLRPLRAVTFFVPDPFKSGGAYVTRTKRVRRLDPVARQLVLIEGQREEVIPLEQILDISMPLSAEEEDP